MQEEMLTKIFEKLVSMESQITSIESRITSMESRITSIELDISNIKQTMATKEDIHNLKDELSNEISNLKEADQAILEMADKTYRKIEEVEREHLAWIHKLTIDCSKNAVDIKLLKERESA